VIISAFAISVIVLTVLLDRLFSTFGLRQQTLTTISAVILIVFWLTIMFPDAWTRFASKTKINQIWHGQKKWTWLRSDILLGVSLGPIFNTCSPTYTILISWVIQTDFITWLQYTLAYVAWLVLILLAIAYGWRLVVDKLRRASHTNGWFKKIIWWILILVWVSILLGRDKQVEAWVLEQWYSIDTTQREYDQVKKVENAKE